MWWYNELFVCGYGCGCSCGCGCCWVYLMLPSSQVWRSHNPSFRTAWTTCRWNWTCFHVEKLAEVMSLFSQQAKWLAEMKALSRKLALPGTATPLAANAERGGMVLPQHQPRILTDWSIPRYRSSTDFDIGQPWCENSGSSKFEMQPFWCLSKLKIASIACKSLIKRYNPLLLFGPGRFDNRNTTFAPAATYGGASRSMSQLAACHS